ncbi:hypothetical protein EBB54_29080 [Schaedlerella arabinosiphila]|uniref:Uncharacterized protein n=1 Tax=Schaedlerella arabinosiphila TaxID=2044587 RepID=A0A426DQB2_9FIRM|nr:hypothetical protein [Schaedlerella arabinosiphila]RRK34938.1 hypothetical protein EBB54_29080 [Schaedlerella arabinosiphila]
MKHLDFTLVPVEIKQLLNSVNEIYINNTHAANFLRDHPEKYELDKPFEPGDCPDSGQITIHGREKLSYFDMCVMDAIYTIEATQKGQINKFLLRKEGKYSFL